MKYKKWKPFYQEIIKEFNYSPKKDIEARNLLEEKIEPINRSKLNKLINEEVIVFGNASTLPKEIKDIELSGTKIVADSAIKTIIDKGIFPDLVVTDLDGDLNYIKKAQKKGSILVVHGHGDNIDKINKFFPKLNPVIGTTQTKPINQIYNFGGFTDGDRAVYLAEEFGAKKIKLLGFDFEEAKGEKQKKLMVAKKLLNYLKNNKEIRLNHKHL